MIPLALSIVFGAGVCLVYEGLTVPRHGNAEGWWRRPTEGALAWVGLPGASPRELLLASSCAAIVAAGATQLMLGWSVVSLLAAALGAAAPIAYLVRRHDRRRAEVQTAMVEAIGQLRDAIRTGLSVPDAFVGLARGGPVAMRPELMTFVREMRLMGFEPAVGAMRDRLADPLFDVVAASLVLNDRLGGRNVSQVLDRLAHATRAQLRIQDELRALQARNVLSAQIVAAMPLVVLVLIRQINPTYLSIFSDWWGQVLLAACLLSIFVGYVGMRWMTRLSSLAAGFMVRSGHAGPVGRIGGWAHSTAHRTLRT